MNLLNMHIQDMFIEYLWAISCECACNIFDSCHIEVSEEGRCWVKGMM